jgi:hypothetical protein
LPAALKQDVDGRDKPGHDESCAYASKIVLALVLVSFYIPTTLLAEGRSHEAS